MATIFDIDFNQQAVDLMPPNKRSISIIAFVRALLKSIQWSRDLVLDSYKNGATADPYAPGTYNKYDQVVYKQRVFESLTSENDTNPDDITNWRLIQNNFIGIDERILYNGTNLVLTYALNKWFGTVFRQPPAVSDIYISTNEILAPIFRVGLTPDVSSTVGLETSSETVGIDFDFTNINEFTIFVPVLVYNALDPAPANRDAVIRNFADRYVAFSLKYNIQTY